MAGILLTWLGMIILLVNKLMMLRVANLICVLYKQVFCNQKISAFSNFLLN